ncbi:uncharacterized protein METZ01_LOCUS151701 [marine metagenome]|jgi:hypothetical protein|uniref:Uncharacterized protein n=1 Tax=marine metagenome TaxID=408172 RepID=A0A382ACX2_9ZZZZ
MHHYCPPTVTVKLPVGKAGFSWTVSDDIKQETAEAGRQWMPNYHWTRQKTGFILPVLSFS